jgi:hypothetical protein
MRAITLRAGTVAAWLVAVTVIAVLRAVHAEDMSVHALACSPDAIVTGRLWTLVTSGLIVAGPPVPQLIMTAIVAVAVVRLAGPGVWWLSDRRLLLTCGANTSRCRRCLSRPCESVLWVQQSLREWYRSPANSISPS